MLSARPIVDAGDRAPSVLNGGLGKINQSTGFAILLLGSASDAYISRGRSKSRMLLLVIWDDPLGLYPRPREGSDAHANHEIKNGSYRYDCHYCFCSPGSCVVFGCHW
jgi:hypothetical protein